MSVGKGIAIAGVWGGSAAMVAFAPLVTVFILLGAVFTTIAIVED